MGTAPIVTPTLNELVRELMATPPDSPMDCWNLVGFLYQQGLDITLERGGEHAAVSFQEVWFETDTAEPSERSKPWDVWVFETRPGWGSNHVGVVTDALKLVHCRKQRICMASNKIEDPCIFRRRWQLIIKCRWPGS